MNNTKAPSSRGMLIPGRRGKLLANSYLPGGEGPYPLVVLCHGIPGIERLFDFAIALREAGFATLSFHYSGNWGSDSRSRHGPTTCTPKGTIPSPFSIGRGRQATPHANGGRTRKWTLPQPTRTSFTGWTAATDCM